MGVLDKLFFWKSQKPATDATGTSLSESDEKHGLAASFPTGGTTAGYRNYTPIVTISYNGEINPGELGVIKRYVPDHRALRLRSWQAYAESEVVQMVVEAYVDWVIGEGLRPNVQPVVEVLDDRGISIDVEEWTKRVELNYKLFLKSRKSVYNRETNLMHKMKEALRNAIIAGDTLAVMEVDENFDLSIQCYDADRIFTPVLGDDATKAKNRGNKIIHGVEVDKAGRHVAYYIWNSMEGEATRIPAIEERTGTRVAWMIYGRKWKYDSTRGMPLISAVLEAIKKIDRYKEAMIGGAEERAKIAYQIVHKLGSTEENPMIENIRSALPLNREVDGAAQDPIGDGIKLQNKIMSTTGKQVFNMPLESELRALASDVEFSFKDFFITNLLPLCASIGVPLEVALKKFESNFSSSRGALKLWEHTMKVTRQDFAFHFGGYIYETWLLLQDIKGNISSPGLFRAIALDVDDLLVQAYTTITYSGPTVPHVDPVKEAKAEREKLGPKGKDVPLTTPQRATENLSENIDIETIKEDFEKQIEGFEVAEPLPDNEAQGGTADPESGGAGLSVAN